MAHALIGLGSNLGERAAHLNAARARLASLSLSSLVAFSSLHESKPAGGPTAQAPYLNAAAVIETSLSPLQLLHEVQQIENNLGRERLERWGPRTIDLDLLLYDEQELDTPELTLPHPRMSFRRFVLEPAAEIAGEMVYPINGWTVGRLIMNLKDTTNEIAFSPTYSDWCRQAPATRLLKALEPFDYVQQVFRRDLENASPTPKQLNAWRDRQRRERRGHLRPPTATPVRRNARWTVMDVWPIQFVAEDYAQDADFDQIVAREIRADPRLRLAVVWQPDDAPVMELLARARRNSECPPLLWIPKVSLEQATQEVIAAMAAME
jgi:2-amino-4-hydroxy-6-hydroxymethyldihydropteridine diphosphokinase